MRKPTVSTFIVIMMVIACSKEEVTPRTYPRVHTNDVTNITSGGATFTGDITFSSVPIIDHGFLWSESGIPLFENADNISLGAKDGPGAIQASCERSLTEGKTYYVRGYAISKDNLVYGNTVEFVSLGSKAPMLKDYYPALATWGDTVTIIGENFSHVNYANTIKFNAIQAIVLKATSDTLLVQVPYELNEELSSISISRTGNTSSLTKQFKLKSPELESINPPTGTIGSNVIISGQYLRGTSTKLLFNNVEGTLVSGGHNFIEYKVPPGLSVGGVEIKVVTGSGNLFATIPFEIKGPQITQVIPTVAGEGDEIKLVGDFFSPDMALNSVTFDNSVATVVSASKTALTVKVPPDVDRISPTISVSLANSTASVDLFSFHAPEVTSFTPNRGIYGTDITIIGKYFRTGSYNKVFMGNMELPYAGGTSPTEIHVYLNDVYTKHSENIKVTYKQQQSISTQKFNMPWILNDYPDKDNAPSASVAYNNKAFVGFGTSNFNTFWKYDPSAKTWSQLSDFPGTRRDNVISFSVGTKGYFGGGTGSYSNLRDLWEYDFSNDTWSQKSDLPVTGSTRVAFSLQNTGYMLALDQINSTLWKYDQSTDSWLAESQAPFAPFENPPFFVIGSTLYLVVNYNLWKYVPSSNLWSDLGPTPEIIRYAFSIASDGYAIGASYGLLYRYDPGLNTWTEARTPLQVFPTPSYVFSGGGKAFVITGNNLLEYDPSF